MKNRFLEQAKREYSPNQRIRALSGEAIIFIIILPGALIFLGRFLDKLLQWQALLYQPANLIVGVLCILSGWLLGMWSNYIQFTIGRGTPVPLMATQKLIIQAPYSYCRNPMALGAIVIYLGVAVLIGSIAAAILVLIGAVILLLYIKLVEEKEMELRFGKEYLAYKEKTPFIIPRLGKRE